MFLADFRRLAAKKALASSRNSFFIMDRFGRNLSIHPLGEDKFRVKVDVVVSDQFLGWIIALPDVTIAAPDNVRERMQEIGERLLKEYQN